MTLNPNNTDAHSKDLRKHRRIEKPGTFFVTKCLQPRKPVLISTGIASEIINTLKFSVDKNRIHLAAFVVMPDHWHTLFGVHQNFTLPKVMNAINSWIGNQTFKILEGQNVCWQDGYHDTRIRSGKQFSYVWHYIENNPVEKELVVNAKDWQWSSANTQYEAILTRPWPWGFEKDVK